MPTFMVVIDKGHRSDNPFSVAFIEAADEEAALTLAAAPHMGYVEAEDEVWVVDKGHVMTFDARASVKFVAASSRQQPPAPGEPTEPSA